MAPYRPNEGKKARVMAAAGLFALILFGSFRLYTSLAEEGASFLVIGLEISYSIIWAGAQFVLLGALVCLFVFGLTSGWGWLDHKTHGFVDLLVDTEGELQKVSWPDKDDLVQSTTVVLVCVVVVGFFLFLVDLAVSGAMTFVNVLPR